MKPCNIMRALAGAGAVGAVAVLAYRIGPAQIAAQLPTLRIALPIVLLAGILRLLLQTRAWWTALGAECIDVPQSRLIAVRLASQAAGYLVALGPVVSEPAKLLLLRHAGAATATLAETGTYWFTSAILGLAGTCAAAFLVADAPPVIGAAGVFGVALVLLVGRRSLLCALVRAAGTRAPGWLRSAAAAEQDIRSFRERQPRAARTVLALNFIAQLVTLAEVAAVLWAVGIQVSVLHVLAIEAAGRMVKVVGAWIPGRIGADEGGAAVSFALLGFSPAAGLMLVLARRARDLMWCAAGVLWTARSGAHRPAARVASNPVSLCLEER
jgi:hypothetical protein